MQISVAAVSVRHPTAARAARLALDGVSLEFKSGEQVAVIGPSGAGKTSLLHVLACAARPESGQLLVDGANPWQIDARALRVLRGRLFLAPQVPPLPPRQRVVTAVLAGRLPHIGLVHCIRSLFYPTGIAEADAALAKFDLQDKLFARTDRLSGGERQRVGLARALLAQAGLLLVDEPLSALDPARGEQALRTLTESARERGSTMVCSMHDVAMALQNFPRIVGLQDGRVAFDLPSAQVSPERLRELYGQDPIDLPAPSVEGLEPAPATPGVVVYCR